MKRVFGPSLAAAIALHLGACVQAQHDLKPFVIGDNAIDKCDSTTMASTPSQAFELHIPTDVLSKLDPATSTSFDCQSVKVQSHDGSCLYSASALNTTPPVIYTAPSQNFDDIVPLSEAAYGPADFASLSTNNWETPFDIDLTAGGGWVKQGTRYRPQLIKIILDNSTYRFMGPKSSNPVGPSAYSVLQGDEGDGMFQCRSDVRQMADGSQRLFVTVRVNYWPNDGKPSLGGLNIGILVPVLKNGVQLKAGDGSLIYAPISIDPMIHNNG